MYHINFTPLLSDNQGIYRGNKTTGHYSFEDERSDEQLNFPSFCLEVPDDPSVFHCAPIFTTHINSGAY